MYQYCPVMTDTELEWRFIIARLIGVHFVNQDQLMVFGSEQVLDTLSEIEVFNLNQLIYYLIICKIYDFS